jgi:hypothetical protein
MDAAFLAIGLGQEQGSERVMPLPDETFEDWRLKTLTLAGQWHRLAPDQVSESLLRDCFAKNYRPWEAARLAAERLRQPGRRPGRLSAAGRFNRP